MSEDETKERVVLGRFRDGDRAKEAVENLMDRDYPMDRISLLGRAHGTGDDPIGIYYHTAGERVAGWGRLGAFWGGIFGLIAGASGLFVVPGVGAVMAAGPIAEALAGAAAGAAATGGAMAGAGAVSHLAVGLRNAGIPEERLDELHQAIENGEYVVLLRCPAGECPEWRRILAWSEPDQVDDFPFCGLFPDG